MTPLIKAMNTINPKRTDGTLAPSLHTDVFRPIRHTHRKIESTEKLRTRRQAGQSYTRYSSNDDGVQQYMLS